MLQDNDSMNTDSPLYLHYKNKLSQSPVFNELSDETLSDMLGRFQHTTWRKNARVEASLLLERFYLIIDGRVRIEHIDPVSGRRITLFLLGPGDGFDVISLLDGQPHKVISVALDDMSLLSTTTQTVREWINRYPEFNQIFLPYLGEYMRKMEALATDLATKDTVTRLARLILRHSAPDPSSVTAPDPSSVNGSYPVRLIHDLSHDSLAHMIGSTRQVVNQHLQALRHKGVVGNQSRHLVVKELEALKEQAESFLSHDHRA